MGLYAGMGFPFGTTLASYFTPKEDLQILRTSIEVIIMTHIRERLMLPGFGSPILEAVFSPGDVILDEQLARIMTETVNFWDRRVDVLNFSVTEDQNGGHEKTVSVTYRDRSSPDNRDTFTCSIPENLVTRI